MKGLIFVIALWVGITAVASMTTTSPIRSPQSGAIGNAVLTTGSPTQRYPVLAVLQPNSSGVVPSFSPSLLTAGKYSPVTGLEEPPQFSLSNGKTVPVYALAKLDPSTRTLVPFAASTGLLSLGAQTGQTQVFANDTNVIVTSSNNTHSLGWASTLAAARGGTGMGVAPAGAILYSTGTGWAYLPAGTAGQTLKSGGAGAPTWQ